MKNLFDPLCLCSKVLEIEHRDPDFICVKVNKWSGNTSALLVLLFYTIFFGWKIWLVQTNSHHADTILRLNQPLYICYLLTFLLLNKSLQHPHKISGILNLCKLYWFFFFVVFFWGVHKSKIAFVCIIIVSQKHASNIDSHQDTGR